MILFVAPRSLNFQGYRRHRNVTIIIIIISSSSSGGGGGSSSMLSSRNSHIQCGGKHIGELSRIFSWLTPLSDKNLMASFCL